MNARENGAGPLRSVLEAAAAKNSHPSRELKALSQLSRSATIQDKPAAPNHVPPPLEDEGFLWAFREIATGTLDPRQLKAIEEGAWALLRDHAQMQGDGR